VAVSFIDRGNRSTRRKSPTCRKSLANCHFISLWENVQNYVMQIVSTCYLCIKYQFCVGFSSLSKYRVLLSYIKVVFSTSWHTLLIFNSSGQRCPLYWQQNGDICYRFRFINMKNWTDAEGWCQAQNSHLVKFETAAERVRSI
jgi:hypothetical protein